MKSRRGIFLFGLIAALLAGCRSSSNKVPLATQPVVVQTVTPANDPPAVPLDTPTALTHKTTNFAHQMESLLQKKQNQGAQTDIKWPEIKRTEAPPSPKTLVVAPPSAEQVKASPLDPRTTQRIEILRDGVKSSAMRDMPAIVPEGEEGVANAPARVAASISDPADIRVEKRLNESPLDISAHLDWQLMKFLHDEPVPQLSRLATLTNEDREIMTTVMDGLSNFRSAVRADSNMLLSRKVRPLLEMSDRLRSQAELAIPTIALCRRVDGFGVYEPVEPTRFAAGKDQQVLVYCEIENFSSQFNEQKKWETRLTQEAVLFTETGMSVWQEKPQNIVDLSRNRRHDFFVCKKMKLPSNLTIGRYLLKVSVVDQSVKRVAEATVPVQIVAE